MVILLSWRETIAREYEINALAKEDSWRMFRIIGELVEGFDKLSGIEAAVQQGLSAQRIWQDLKENTSFRHGYDSIKRFVRPLKRRRPEMADVMEHLLTGYYVEGWAGVQSLVKEMSTLYGQRVVLTDGNGIVVGDSGGNLLGKIFSSDWPSQKLLSPQGGTILGTLYVVPELSAEIVLTRGLGESINRFLLWGGVLAVIAALVLTSVLSRRISSPVQSLAVTARRLG